MRRDTGNAAATAVARRNHDVVAAIERSEHDGKLIGMVGVVAIHDEQHVVVGAALGDMRNQAAQAFPQAHIDRLADDLDVELFAPFERALDGAIGASVVVEHDPVAACLCRETPA